jgi:general secretion pathway protein E
LVDNKKVASGKRQMPQHVITSPKELPAQRVISGTSRKAAVVLTPEQAKHLAVLEHGQVAYIVADQKLHALPDTTALFQDLRNRLANKSQVSVLWASSDLIAQLGQLRVESGDGPSAIDSSTSDAAILLHEWVEYALAERASDIHLEVRTKGARSRFRIDGDLEDGGQYMPALAQSTAAYVYNKMTDSGSTSSSQFQSRKHSYAMVTLGEGEGALKLRCQTIALVNGFDLVMRLLRTESKQLSYAELGYTEDQAQMIHDATVTLLGLVLIAGVTGSGKTTTVRTILQSIPGREKLKLATIEDPVEYIVDGVSHTHLQRDVANDDESAKVFGEAVKSWMRGDPDLLSVGELRDLASGTAALSEAETGHMALGTVHANTAAGIMQRLVSPGVGLDRYALTAPDVISLLIYQALVPLLCDHCKVPIEEMPAAVQNRFRTVAKKFNVDVWTMHFKKPGGCPHCRKRGTKGVQVVAEIIQPDREFLSLMRERREFEAVDHWLAGGDGQYDTPNMQGKTVFHHAFYLALQGLIDATVPERFGKYEKVELVSDRLERARGPNFERQRTGRRDVN